ncbi:hypothetical protein ACQ4PT_023283 [Festuca glaucescens]
MARSSPNSPSLSLVFLQPHPRIASCFRDRVLLPFHLLPHAGGAPRSYLLRPCSTRDTTTTASWTGSHCRLPSPRLRLLCPPLVSRIRRLLVRISASERVVAAGTDEKPAAVNGEAEAGSVGLDRMVLSFMEESAAVAERPPRGRCNCFSGSNYKESDNEEDFFLPPGLASTPRRGRRCTRGSQGFGAERERGGAEPLADASRIAERCGRTCKGKECRRAVADGPRALGYDAGVCKSRWEKAPSYPAGRRLQIQPLRCFGSCWLEHSIWSLLLLCSDFQWDVAQSS